MKAKTKKEVAAGAGAVAALLIGGGLSMISGPIAACAAITLGVAFAWIALTLTEWFELTVRLWVKALGCVVILMSGCAVGLVFSLGSEQGVPDAPLTDPEAAANKYVRKTWVSPPDKKFTIAYLVEFGVNKRNSVGVAVGIEFTGDSFEFWHGEPNRTDKQQQRLPTGWDRNELRSGEILWLNHPDYQITPQRSLYVCVLSYDQKMQEPNDILFLAMQLNEAKGQPTKTRLGHQYQIKP